MAREERAKEKQVVDEERTWYYLDPEFPQTIHLLATSLENVEAMAKAFRVLHKLAMSGARDGVAKIQGSDVDYILEWHSAINHYEIRTRHVYSI